MPNKITPIKYTSRDFNSIKNDLIQHAKRFYPDTFKDFNEGSFGSLMLDTVAYIGDILSFYIDYQANESYLDTASEYNNVLKIARQLGFKFGLNTTHGIASFAISVPADPIAGPDLRYAPILKKGSSFSTADGTRFILTNDVRFDLSNTISIDTVTTNGGLAAYILIAYGPVVSGKSTLERISVGDYERFLKVYLPQNNIVEILSVFDDEGNEYYEVPNLAQNVIFKSYPNKDPETSALASEILKPFLAVRRFSLERDLNNVYLQFGGGSDAVIGDNKNMLIEPQRSVLQMFGKEYISDTSFDPNILLQGDKLGISPSNTNLNIEYIYLPDNNSLNYSVGSLNKVTDPKFSFFNEEQLTYDKIEFVKNSLEVRNESPILGDTSIPDSKELKIRIKNFFSSQNRAVTSEDYKALAYGLPSKFGSIKRITVLRDEDSLRKNLNMYILSEDSKGKLIISNQIVKNNLKNWLQKHKMLNDTIDILDGKIVNFGIEFKVIGKKDKNKYDILSNAVEQLKKDFSSLQDFGQTFYMSDIMNSLRKVENVLDVVSVDLVPKVGLGKYSDFSFDFKKRTSVDKRYINVPLNVILELKYPDIDIKGSII